MGKDDVDVGQIQALEGQVDTLDNVLARETDVVQPALGLVNVSRVVLAVVDLGGDDKVVLLPAKVLDGLAEDDLGLRGRVVLAGVEEVDTGIVGGLEARVGLVYRVLEEIRERKILWYSSKTYHP